MDVRHCGFCLLELSSESVKKCAKCSRRVYCSKECQERDWHGKWPNDRRIPFGQGHKNWCGMDYGEEDLDWKVTAIEGKGLGIVALRPIPPKYRIMVDACQWIPAAHPGMKDLQPLDGTIMEKFQLNNFTYGSNEPAIVCMRIARLNHGCDPNASHHDVEINNFRVKVLYAERTITVGEEIVICYTPQWYDHTRPPIDHRQLLKEDWNIICPENCVCRKAEVNEAIKRAREKNVDFFRFCETGKSREALKAMSQVLMLDKSIHIPFVRKKTTLFDGFQMAETPNKIKEYINEVCDIFSSISHPKDTKMVKYAKFKASPYNHQP